MPLLKPLVWGTPPSSSRLNATGVSVPRAWGGRYAPVGLVGVAAPPMESACVNAEEWICGSARGLALMVENGQGRQPI